MATERYAVELWIGAWERRARYPTVAAAVHAGELLVRRLRLARWRVVDTFDGKAVASGDGRS